MTPNKYQLDIYDHIKAKRGHAMVDAVAGSGKTTTIVAALEMLPMDANVLFVAFNRHIAEELKKRVPLNCEAATLNSLGYSIVRNSTKGYTKIKETKTEDVLWFEVFGGKQVNRGKYYRSLTVVKRLVGLFKSYAIMEPTIEDCEFFSDRYEFCPEENGEFELAIRTHLAGMKQKTVLDFDDQIFYPLAFDYKTPTFDYVFVDETQDLNPAQIELVKRVCDRDGMIVAVGDTRQAIYGFRGADPQAMDHMVKSLNMTCLPLSVCYRCAKNIVIEAQKEVPHIEYCETAEEGAIKTMHASRLLSAVQPGDFILCRTTAPLVELVLQFIREGRKAFVRGRDFGQSLLNIIQYIHDLDAYEQKMQLALQKKPAALLTTQDQIDTMRVLVAMYHDEASIRRAISDIFENDGKGIMLSTIHRSKGLETDRVFLIRPDLVPHPRATQDWMIDQEHNLKYIAVTRAKKEFVYVTMEAGIGFEDIPVASRTAPRLLESAFDRDEDVLDLGEDEH